MNVKKLKEFRAKLEYAKGLCSWRGFNVAVVGEFMDAGLQYKCANTGSMEVMPDDVYVWYTNPDRTPAEREAMWDNSITAVDVRIAKENKNGN